MSLARQRHFKVSDDMAYVLPMGTFLAILSVGGTWPEFYVVSYWARTILVAAMLIYFWPKYTKISTDYWWLGVIVGVLGLFQWLCMQLFLQSHLSFFKPPAEFFNPMRDLDSELARRAFFIVRTLGAVLVVPVMEELFWRDYLWRTILAPNDFKLAQVGEWNWKPFLVVVGMFATVHGNWWLTAIIWAAMIGALLVYTKSLGACIIAHATTNLLLAVYVLKTHDWAFW